LRSRWEFNRRTILDEPRSLRRTAGTAARLPHFAIVTQTSKADRALARAARLRNEARNCLSIATSMRDTQFAAQLIDEAVQLARRAREIAA
jgi:hypothetical protein